MNELPVWWLTLEAVGIAAFPLTFVFFRWLPDRGVTFVKAVGLLLLGYGFWMSGVLGLMAPSRGSVIVVLIAIAAISWVAGIRLWSEIRDYLRSGWRYILLVEVMFLVVLAAAVYLRSFAPAIDSGEKPFELAFLNAINRAESFPPPDPWLSGENISYYYFGYVIIAALTKLTFLQTSVTFFLGLSTIAALTWVAVFGLAYNIVQLARVETGLAAPRIAPRAVTFGLAAAALVLIVGNLEGVFELMARHGVGGDGFYGLVGINGLDGPYDCDVSPSDCREWYPTRYYWWWWATRMGSPADIQEFPFFSLHFGDLHAHVLVMPFVIVLLATVLQMMLSARDAPTADRTFDGGWLLRHPTRALLIVLLAGGIAFIDGWAIPLTVALLSAGVLLANWLRGASIGRVLMDSGSFLMPVLLMAFALYLPYYLDLQADRDGVAITQTAATLPGEPPENSESTRPLHFALFWAPVLISVLAVLAVSAWRSRPLRSWGLAAMASASWAVPLLVWTVWAAASDGPDALIDEASERAEDLLTLAFLAVMLTAVSALLLRSLTGRRDSPDRTGPFVWLITCFALLMLFGAELFYVEDTFGWRANTVFRFWHEAWIILGIVSAYGLFRLTESWRLSTASIRSVPVRHVAVAALAFGIAYTAAVAIEPWETLYERWWTATPGLVLAGIALLAFAAAAAVEGRAVRDAWPRLLWVGVTAVVFCSALVYPVLVAFDRSGGFTNDQTLDGLDFVTRGEPYEREAIDWLNANVEGTPVILEAFGDDFGPAGRISSRTGMPTVIGWLNHERQWRGDPDPFDSSGTPYTVRPQEVARLYNTPVAGEAQIFIDKYGIEYVYVGSLERATYDIQGLFKFGEFMDVVFQNPGVTIYRVRADGLAPARVGD
jgi:YYY domain-containing protein